MLLLLAKLNYEKTINSPKSIYNHQIWWYTVKSYKKTSIFGKGLTDEQNQWNNLKASKQAITLKFTKAPVIETKVETNETSVVKYLEKNQEIALVTLGISDIID